MLVDKVVPFNRIMGDWSWINSSWIMKPQGADFRRMDRATSDVDLVLHLAHHQRYWKKRQENDNKGIVWTRMQYTDYVCEYLSDAKNVDAFFSCFQAAQ